jgi:hypothetical protein
VWESAQMNLLDGSECHLKMVRAGVISLYELFAWRSLNAEMQLQWLAYGTQKKSCWR